MTKPVVVSFAERPRSLAEMDFAASLVPCPSCGTREGGFRWYSGGDPPGTYEFLDGACSRCKTPRRFRFGALRSMVSPPMYQLGGAEPSEVLTPEQLAAEVDRAKAEVPANPSWLPHDELRTKGPLLARGRTAATELAKFQGLSGERFARARLEADLATLTTLTDVYRDDAKRRSAEAGPKPAGATKGARVDKGARAAHDQWLKAGRSGDGRMKLAGVDLSNEAWTTARLSHAQLVECALDRIDLSYADLREARLARCTGARPTLSSAKLGKARFEECTFHAADARLSTAEDTIFEGGSWKGLLADRGLWLRVRATGVDFSGAVFADTVLDGAHFVDCDLRGVDLRRVKLVLQTLGTTLHAKFVRCDLRGAKLDGRRLDQTRFEDCKLWGISGAPKLEGGVTVVRADLSEAGDGSRIVDGDGVFTSLAAPRSTP